MKKTALITGASRGIGKAIAIEFINNGFDVIAPTRKELDLSSQESINNYFLRLEAPVDILINNAGINPISEFTALNINDIEETLNVNFLAPFLLSKLIVPSMINRGFGRIVNISSIWSIVSKQDRSIYASTKSAINGFTRSLAIEVAKHNILVNSVAPGFVNTELTKQNNSEAEIKKIAESLPIKRLAEPEEIAKVVYFLCSENNSFITGQTIIADGGYTCL